MKADIKPPDEDSAATRVDGVTEATVQAAVPAVLDKPTAQTFSFPKSENSISREDGRASAPSLRLIKGGIGDVRDAVVSGYEEMSASTDAFVHESPWKSIAFAALGGIIVGMLAAR
ncbi:glycine zipper domain-containing protein [Paraburkholderia sp. XV]|uniref:glycine zipper domain-containing protein n=1 Tax=Paraburkholderia sp. XV TaxID=2831520 RepID=UPI001CD438B4|nr:hypothetical protein [Paraburkholderia sp. XV]